MFTMRSTALRILSAFALAGCSSPETTELPSPDVRDEIYILIPNKSPYELGTTCEELGNELAWEGFFAAQGFVAPDECEPCECGPAACAVPPKVTAHPSICPGEGVVGTLDAGASWDGSCAAAAVPIESDDYASVTFEPPTLAPCAPVSPAPNPSLGNLRFARACKSVPPGYAPTDSLTCYPPQPNGDCWYGARWRREYPMLNDTRKCSPCSCGAPGGGNCAVKTSLYKDKYCFDEIGNDFLSDHDAPICTRTTDAPLAAMRSVFTQNEPGTCAPSTDSTIVSGSLEPRVTRVVCCEQ